MESEAERWLRVVVDAMPDAVLVIDRERRIRMTNRAAERLFRCRREDLIDKQIEAMIPSRFRDQHRALAGAFIAARSARAHGAGRELVALCADGTELAVEIGLTPLETPGGRFTLASLIDITERKRAMDELRRSNAELERFAYLASHDLQEPLRMVASYVELLGQRYRGRLDESADRYIFHAVDGARRMQRLINDVLAYARIGSLGAPLVPVAVGSIVEGVLATLEPEQSRAAGAVEVGALPTVIADEGQLVQLLQNLIVNALKFRGECNPRVRIDAVRDGGCWRFSVADNGIGIDPKDAERVFEMFQRLHERSKYEGSGIGLAIARRIVERHGGQIWVEPTPGGGATFQFTLPAA
jgi:PAS domain S-box-containing protein